MHYQIQYFNKMWNDWLMFDQLFYKSEVSAQKRIDEYKESIPDIKTRIIQTTVMAPRPKVSRKKKDIKVTTETVTRQPH
jgi:hypothetical protein